MGVGVGVGVGESVGVADGSDTALEGGPAPEGDGSALVQAARLSKTVARAAARQEVRIGDRW